MASSRALNSPNLKKFFTYCCRVISLSIKIAFSKVEILESDCGGLGSPG